MRAKEKTRLAVFAVFVGVSAMNSLVIRSLPWWGDLINKQCHFFVLVVYAGVQRV